jgi:predicted 3-demethylubiquinone-9 3-methyltransferase (glyoxalase superfamily)
MFMEKDPTQYLALRERADILINSKDTMTADEYEQALISFINDIHKTQLYEEELKWFTDRFGITIVWVPWM